MEKSIAISEGESRSNRDLAVVEYFRAIGFENASPDDWCAERDRKGLYMKSLGRSFLCFVVTPDHVMKAPRSVLEKILVLGLP
jgi:hypothetical protein